MNIKYFLCGFLAAAVLLMSVNTFSEGTLQSISLLFNSINVKINDKSVTVESILYNGSPYVQLKTITETLGSKYDWDEKSKTASISNKGGTSPSATPSGQNPDNPIKLTGTFDAYNPVIKISDLGLEGSVIDNFKLEKNDEVIYKTVAKVRDSVKITDGTAIYGQNILELNSSYLLKVYCTDGKIVKYNFSTGGLPPLIDNGQFKLAYIPAMPEKGFNFPYYITLPSSDHKSENMKKKRYLLVEPNNTGRPSDDFNIHLKSTYELAQYFNTKSTAEQLWLPRLIPVFPRPETPCAGQPVYLHQFTRNSICLEDLLKIDKSNEAFFKPVVRFDKQLCAMMDHAVEYLNKYGSNLDTKKVFMWGYSASGGFVNAFATLYPERVKAVVHGGFPVIPTKEVNGTPLLFPTGVYDYKSITGKEFDINAFNSVARFAYIGDKDTNNLVLPFDIFNKEEQDMINKVLAPREYPDRWNKALPYFKNAGGKAHLAIYKGAGHQTFYEKMGDDYVNFFNANRDSTSPVYPKLADPNTSYSVLIP